MASAMTLKEGTDVYFELAFSPCVSQVSTVRRFVSDFYGRMLADADATSRIALATHELLENTVRYSLDGKTAIRIGLRREEGATVVEIQTRNRSSQENATTLTRLLDEMAQAPDANEFYLILMQRSAKRRDGSGLGMGRIRAESEMQVSYRLEGDVIALLAEARLEDGGAS
jgi:anti-sigma regulatory factor (Ser/Thr protein kinase)